MVNGVLGINEFESPVNLEKNDHAGFYHSLFHSSSSRRTIKCNSFDSPFKLLACGQYAYMGQCYIQRDLAELVSLESYSIKSFLDNLWMP